MNVLVVGGTGFVGRSLVRELIDRKHDVAVLSRSPAASSLPDVVETIAGDVRHPESIEDAFAGRDSAINLVALSPLFEPPDGSTHEAVHLDGTRHVVRAAETHGVDRFVQMSALGADPDGPTAYIRSKGQAETVVEESSLDRIIVRPSVVFGDGGEFISFTKTLTTPYLTGLPGGGSTRFQPIWIGDLVAMLAETVETDDHTGNIYELGGPDVLTLAEITKQVYHADGTGVAVVPIPMVLARIGLTIGGMVPRFPMGADQYRSLRFDNTVSENDVTAFDRRPDGLRTLADYLDLER